MKENRVIIGKYLGYFTSEIFSGGSNYFKFTHHNHISLIEETNGIVHKKDKDGSFQIYVSVTIKKQDLARSLIKSKDLVMVEFEEGKLSEVYELNPLGIHGVSV
ncbi:MAG: hypothetical protein R3B60_01940 [Candidatus Paceibacterota bacterium]